MRHSYSSRLVNSQLLDPAVLTGGIKPTGGHTSFRVDAPQSIAVLRNQIDGMRAGSTVDLRGTMFHIRGQQLTIGDPAETIVGGVFVIDPTATFEGAPTRTRSGVLIRDRARPLRFVGTTFILREWDASMEAVVYCYNNSAVVTFDGCTFGGMPLVDGFMPNSWHDLAHAGPGRFLSCKAGNRPAGGIVVRDCAFLGSANHQAQNNGTGLDAITVGGVLAGNQRDTFRATKRPVAVTHPVQRVEVLNSVIVGGYYGLGLSAVESGLVSGNHISNNIRSISMQDSCRNIEVRNNILSGYLSAGVHMAYGTSNCTVARNVCTSGTVIGQAHIQAYCGSVNNRIDGNSVRTAAGSGPAFGIYVGNGSSATVTGNNVTGRFKLAAIGVERSWAVRTTWGYTSIYSGDTDLGVTGDVDAGVVRGNRITSIDRHYVIGAAGGVLALDTDAGVALVDGSIAVWTTR